MALGIASAGPRPLEELKGLSKRGADDSGRPEYAKALDDLFCAAERDRGSALGVWGISLSVYPVDDFQCCRRLTRSEIDVSCATRKGNERFTGGRCEATQRLSVQR